MRASPYWRQVSSVVRPYGAAIHRSRPPLTLRLYAAARDGRLVWRTPGEFALLEPPIVRMRDWVGSKAGRTWLARLDRWWGGLVFGVPPFALMMLALPVAFVPAVGVIAASLLLLLATVYVVVQMAGGALRLPFAGRSSQGDEARGFHWTVTLCHATDPAHVDRLLRAALDRSKELAAAHIQPDIADGTHVVICLEQGITTTAARTEAVTSPSVLRAGPDGSGVLVVRDSDDFRPPDPDAQRPINVVPVLLGLAPLTVAANAVVVADIEQAACRAAQDCAGRPATWLDAASWLLSQMAFQDHELVAATSRAQILGLTIRLLTPAITLCLVVAGWRHVRYKRRSRELRYEQLRTAFAGSARVLVLVVLDIERDAIIQAVADAGGTGARLDNAGGHAIFRLGRLGETEIIVAQSTQGTVTPAAMMLTANHLIEELKPHYVVLAGICFGLWSRELDGGDQELGDIVVSEYVQNVDHRRVTTEQDVELTLWRGERVQASRTLLTAFRAATHGWTGRRVRAGIVLSANVLSDSAAFRATLRRDFQEASAGEMELTGVCAAARNHGRDWIMVKGISDWGAGGLNDDTRQTASASAAAFIVHAITCGALPPPPSDR